MKLRPKSSNHWRVLKWIAASILCFGFVFINFNSPSAAISIPQKVRIGLYYESTAVSNFTIGSENGLQIGSFRDSSFVPLYNEPANNPVMIRKDAFFVKSANNTLTFYNPSSQTIPAGDRLGPIHIRIGGSYPDITTANVQVTDMRQKGIMAYPVFVDEWQVWTGFYVDQNTAQLDIPLIQNTLGDSTYSVVPQAANRIVVLNNSGDVVFIFGSDVCKLQVHPMAENNPYVFKINNNDKYRYRGDLEIRRFTGSDMTVINILSPDQYLYGVVPSEIESGSNPEALKAQAVAARTYMLNNMGKHKKYDFDLCTTTACQVYKGYNNEAASTNTAIDDTAGRKLTYNSKLAEVFYYSSSGGMTEDVKNVWGSDIPYLKSVEDKYESGKSWHYNWETSLTADKVKEIMSGRGYDLGDILSIAVTKVSTAGRATELIIKGTKNQRTYTLDGCRTVFGLDSQWYTISTDADINVKSTAENPSVAQLGSKKVMTSSGLKALPSAKNSTITVLGADGQKKAVPVMPVTYKFTGKGWGHGVGMSQEGAKGMANAGFKYDEILTHYFQGTIVE